MEVNSLKAQASNNQRKQFTLKTKLSLTIAFVSLLTIALISLLSNFLIQDQFKGYIISKQKNATKEIVATLSQHYNKTTGEWDTDFVHTIGMNALYNGYIVKVYDLKNNTVWDAQACDMTSCNNIMDDISHRMMTQYPLINGKFTSTDFQIKLENETIGTANISFYGPFFLSENDFRFLNSLNTILIFISMFSLVFSVVIGFFMAKRISHPILKTIGVTKQISDGEYDVRIEEETNTKEINELIQSINHLANSLGNQENLRKQLTSDVAHELRTPLTTLQTHIEAMVEGIWEPDQERLQSCYDETVRLGKLVKELESLARVDYNNLKLEKEQVNLLKIVKTVLLNFEAELKNKAMSVSISGFCSDIFADKDRISQVVINLLSNAIKYTSHGGNIDINLSETDKSITFSIQDNGSGIPSEELPFIFERFYRADKSRNRKTGGTGIGLAIVKSIVTAHGGTVEVNSVLNEGSCFEITLPNAKK